MHTYSQVKMDGAKVSFLHVSQNVPTDSPMEVMMTCIKFLKAFGILIYIWYMWCMYDEGDDEQAQGKPDPCLTDSATLKVFSIRIS